MYFLKYLFVINDSSSRLFLIFYIYPFLWIVPYSYDSRIITSCTCRRLFLHAIFYTRNGREFINPGLTGQRGRYKGWGQEGGGVREEGVREGVEGEGFLQDSDVSAARPSCRCRPVVLIYRRRFFFIFMNYFLFIPHNVCFIPLCVFVSLLSLHVVRLCG